MKNSFKQQKRVENCEQSLVSLYKGTCYFFRIGSVWRYSRTQIHFKNYQKKMENRSSNVNAFTTKLFLVLAVLREMVFLSSKRNKKLMASKALSSQPGHSQEWERVYLVKLLLWHRSLTIPKNRPSGFHGHSILYKLFALGLRLSPFFTSKVPLCTQGNIFYVQFVSCDPKNWLEKGFTIITEMFINAFTRTTKSL